MGKALRQEHLDFFTRRMNEHSRVIRCLPVSDEHEYLFAITRNLSGTESRVMVHLTDAYKYSIAEFYVRPSQIRSDSYVVIGMPHASADSEVIEKAKEHRIGVGHIGKFMGALNYPNFWDYMTSEERRQKEEEQRRREGGST